MQNFQIKELFILIGQFFILKERGCNMRIEMLEDIFKEAKEKKCDICVEVTIPGQEETEFIINRNSSLNNKLEYYKKAYDKNCVHIGRNEIRIVSVTAITFDCEI